MGRATWQTHANLCGLRKAALATRRSVSAGRNQSNAWHLGMSDGANTANAIGEILFRKVDPPAEMSPGWSKERVKAEKQLLALNASGGDGNDVVTSLKFKSGEGLKERQRQRQSEERERMR